MADDDFTNISAGHLEAFEALRNEKVQNFALFSCFVNGEPTSAIVSVDELADGDVRIIPLFVAVTESMVLTDHNDIKPKGLDG
jgi:hypothetical protein